MIELNERLGDPNLITSIDIELLDKVQFEQHINLLEKNKENYSDMQSKINKFFTEEYFNLKFVQNLPEAKLNEEFKKTLQYFIVLNKNDLDNNNLEITKKYILLEGLALDNLLYQFELNTSQDVNFIDIINRGDKSDIIKSKKDSPGIGKELADFWVEIIEDRYLSDEDIKRKLRI